MASWREKVTSAAEKPKFTDQIRPPDREAKSWRELVGRNQPETRRFVDRVRNRANRIYLVRGKDSRKREAWYYLEVHPTHKYRFEVDLKTGSLKLTDYGQVLESGFGKNPPKSVQKRMQEEFGFAS